MACLQRQAGHVDTRGFLAALRVHSSSALRVVLQSVKEGRLVVVSAKAGAVIQQAGPVTLSNPEPTYREVAQASASGVETPGPMVRGGGYRWGSQLRAVSTITISRSFVMGSRMPVGWWRRGPSRSSTRRPAGFMFKRGSLTVG